MADPIQLAGAIGIVAMAVAFYLLRNYLLAQAKAGKSVFGLKLTKKGLNSLTGTLAVAAVVAIGFGIAEDQGYVAGPVSLLKGLPIIGDSIPFTAQQVTEPVSTTTTETKTVSGTCVGLASPPDLLVQSTDAENPSTAITETTNLYRQVGTTVWNNFTAGTEITDLQAGATYQFVMGIATSDYTDNAYGQVFKYTIGCQEDDTVEKKVYNDEIETSLTATFYNTDLDASAETMIAGEVADVALQWQAGTDEVYGNPYIASSGLADNGKHSTKFPNLLQLQLNKTTLDEPESVYVAMAGDQTIVGQELDRIGCPTLATTTSHATDYCYEAPVITDARTRIGVKLVADSTNAPAHDPTAYLYAGNYYVDSDTGELSWGVEDNDGNAVGADAADELTIDLTA